MAFLARYGGVQPSEFSEDIRRNGMTHIQAIRLQREVVKLRKGEVDLEIKLARLSAGLPLR